MYDGAKFEGSEIALRLLCHQHLIKEPYKVPKSWYGCWFLSLEGGRTDLEGRVVSQREKLQLKTRPRLQLLGEQEVLVQPHHDPLDPLLGHHRDLTGRGLRGGRHQREHRESGQRPSQLKYMEMRGDFVSHEGLDVEVNGNVPWRKERNRDTGGHFLGMDNVTLSL